MALKYASVSFLQQLILQILHAVRSDIWHVLGIHRMVMVILILLRWIVQEEKCEGIDWV